MTMKKRILSLSLLLVSVTLLSGCSMVKQATNEVEKQATKEVQKQTKKFQKNHTKYHFKTQAEAEKIVIPALEKRFKGKTFALTTLAKGDTIFTPTKGDKPAVLVTHVKDQNGLVGQVVLTNNGNLDCDYFTTFYTHKFAQPVLKLLAQFDFVKNVAVDQMGAFDPTESDTNLSLTAKEYWGDSRNSGINTGGQLTVGIFLPANQTKEEYVKETMQVYNALYDKQSSPFDLQVFIENDRFGPVAYGGDDPKLYPGYLGQIASYYIYDNANNKIAPIRTTAKMMGTDMDPDRYYDGYHITRWWNYGIVWKHQPVQNYAIRGDGDNSDEDFSAPTQADYNAIKLGNPQNGDGGTSLIDLIDKFGTPSRTEFVKGSHQQKESIEFDGGMKLIVIKHGNNGDWRVIEKVSAPRSKE